MMLNRDKETKFKKVGGKRKFKLLKIFQIDF